MRGQPFLEAGRIVGTHGVRGEVRVEPWCDSPQFLAKLKKLYFDNGARELRVCSRVHKSLVLMKIDGVDTVNDAATLRGQVLYLARKDVKLAPDRHFIADLLGCRIVDADTEEEYGTVCDVSATASSDIYHMKTAEGREVLIPVIPDIVLSVDTDAAVIRIRPMAGLWE